MPRKSTRPENVPKRMYTLIPPQLRERAAVLVLDEGCTISDVADIMNVNRSALSKVVQRARKARALEPPLVAGGAANGGDDAHAAAAAMAIAAADAKSDDLTQQQAAAPAQALGAKPVGRGKAAINRHKAATSVSFEGALCFPGPSMLTFFKYLNRTKKSMDICVESIRCDDIAKTIIAAKTRGVRVRVITNELERAAEGSVIQKLVDAGIPVRSHETMRHRFCLLDNMTLLHGSFSWSRSDNAEDLAVRTGGPLITRFRYQFDSLLAAYEPTGAAKRAAAAAAAAAGLGGGGAIDTLTHAQAMQQAAAAAAAAVKRQRVGIPAPQELAHMSVASIGAAMVHEQHSFVAMHQQLQQQFPMAAMQHAQEMAPAQLLTSLVEEQVLQLPPLPQDHQEHNPHHQQRQPHQQQLHHHPGEENHSLASDSRNGAEDGTSDFGRVTDDE